ncbi:helix-turn-helix domain-containing protein [Enterococcus xiangfangensis]|uniref:XRE family transcriptional regulator n=1 Tax=Enterococcus xiangfangensis TaxID=1296537 RepID=A0ABU3F926_9ENTE|nr:XRE family transcriptional regulator [Enterococcus xiangfangensis]MDT2759154.1 XRE family transcriptional regulator [Enterococcus xiangfangensis]
MTEINQTFSNNLKQYREKRNLSLDNIASLTGVSKSMLAQIEKGSANPTINTVWKIANGLKISFTELMTAPEEDFEVVREEKLSVLTEDDGHYRNYPIFPFNDQRGFEIYRIELDPGAFLQAEPHPSGTQEFITVFAGEIEVEFLDQKLIAKAGEGIRFKADTKHSYHNPSDKLTTINMVIWYETQKDI